MDIIVNGVKLSQYKYTNEEEFEADIVQASKSLFGEKSIYIDYKRKISGNGLGNSIPDGFLLNFTNEDNPDFYIVEVELAKHDLYRHIFPQITKFFSFFSNSQSRNDLADKIYSIIESNDNIKNEIKSFCKGREIYKLLKDSIDDNQNILLIIDENKPELLEIFNTYKEWENNVNLEIIRKYRSNSATVFTMEPEFDEIEFFIDNEIKNDDLDSAVNYNESDHINNKKDDIKKIYYGFKEKLLSINNSLIFNPQKYYISIKNNKNIVYIKVRQKKIRFIIMLEHSIIKERIKKCYVKEISQGVQDFYNGPCAAVDLDNINNMDEVIDLIKLLI